MRACVCVHVCMRACVRACVRVCDINKQGLAPVALNCLLHHEPAFSPSSLVNEIASMAVCAMLEEL